MLSFNTALKNEDYNSQTFLNKINNNNNNNNNNKVIGNRIIIIIIETELSHRTLPEMDFEPECKYR